MNKTSRTIYLDYAAATPLADEVRTAMVPYEQELFFNPSAPYAPARAVKADVEDARRRIASVLGAKLGCIHFTAGATEATNLAFGAFTGHVIVSADEHESVLACARTREHTMIGVEPDGRVKLDELSSALRPDTELLSFELANGETGTIQGIREISSLVAEERKRRLADGNSTKLLLHCDVSQAATAKSISVSSLGCDLMTVSAAKIYGPKQVGLLWAKEGVELRPLVLGGGQEQGLRSGTENVAGIVGFARALELADELREYEAKRERELRRRFLECLGDAYHEMLILGPSRDKLRLPGHLTLSFPGLEARRLVLLLEEEGVYVATGSACAASRMKTSHVFLALGLSEEAAQGSIRISFGRPTTGDDVERAARVLASVVSAEACRVGVC